MIDHLRDFALYCLDVVLDIFGGAVGVFVALIIMALLFARIIHPIEESKDLPPYVKYIAIFAIMLGVVFLIGTCVAIFE